MKKEKKYIDINKRIAHNILELAYNQGEDSIYLDDVLVAVWEAVVYLDTANITPDEWKKRHVASMRSVLTHAATWARYKNYTRQALGEALRKEKLSTLAEEEDLKRSFLTDIRLIQDIDETGLVVLDEKLKKTYMGIAPVPLEFGVMPYEGVNVKRNTYKKKVNNTSVTLRDDVETALRPFIENYINDWKQDVEWEEYKWNAVRVFQEKFNIAAPNLAANLRESMSASENLLAGPFYFPLSMLIQLAQHSQEEVRMALRNLYDEEQPLTDRCQKFLQDTEQILQTNKGLGIFKEKDKSMQSIRSVSVYLALRYPNRHYLYKQSVYYDFRAITATNLPSLSAFESVLVGYEMVCNELRRILMKNERLLELHDKSYPYDRSEYKLLTQDFMYYCAYHYQHLGHK